jgi:hypothetical protein
MRPGKLIVANAFAFFHANKQPSVVNGHPSLTFSNKQARTIDLQKLIR